MRYRIAHPEDFDDCAECVASTGYYMPVDFEAIQGIVLMAENEDGVQGVVWAARSGARAFADYLAVRPDYQGTGLGLRLIAKGCAILRKLGVKQIQSITHYDNKEAMRINRALGIVDGPYAITILDL